MNDTASLKQKAIPYEARKRKDEYAEMKIDKAVKWIDHRMMYGRYTLSLHNPFVKDECYEAGEMAIDALRKQQPKEPTYEGDGYDPDGNFIWDEWLCPKCGSRYEVDYDEYNYCPNCGQAIDWGQDIIKDEKGLAE